MTASELAALTPLAALGLTSLAIVMAIAVRRHHAAAFALTLAGLLIAGLGIIPASAAAPIVAGELFRIDELSLGITGVFVITAIVVALMSRPYLAHISDRPEEYYALLAIATAGGVALVSTNHLAGLFIAIETMSVALYGLIAYARQRMLSIEAAIKYLIMTGAASAVLLFGVALIYVDTGGLSFASIATAASGTFSHAGLAGLALMIAGLAFKLAVAPFHMWVPDVYQGAPAPVAALIATISKGAVVIVSFRMLSATGALAHPEPLAILTALAIASMVAGNLLALLQTRVKRLLAYSSIAHLGYLLVGVIAADALGLEAVVFYLVAYFLMTLLAFGVVAALSTPSEDADALATFRGLCFRRPLLGLTLVISLLSLIGVPLTAGFMAKVYVLAAGASQALWSLVITLAVTSAVGAFYYIRLIAVTLARPEAAELETRTSVEMGTLLAVLAIGVVLAGAAPWLLDPLLTRAAGGLF
jgi:NADH-quinone oxidoreductase subunit N